MKARSKRLMLVGGGVVLLVAAVALVLSAFQQNLVFFHTPTEIAEGKAPLGKTFRVGGMVEEGSIAREAGHAMPIVLIAGMLTGAFGGVLRDILCNEVPLIFQKELYAIISLLTGAVYLLLLHFNNFE